MFYIEKYVNGVLEESYECSGGFSGSIDGSKYLLEPFIKKDGDCQHSCRFS